MINDSSVKQLNPFEIKAEITSLISKLHDVKDFASYEIHYRTLDLQNDKNIITKLLFKEIPNIMPENVGIVKFLLMRYAKHEVLINHLWSIIKNNMSTSAMKIFALDFLRELDTEWSYEECEEYLNTDELVDRDTQKLLDKAIINPEVQIDFLDFIQALSDDDKLTLLRSLNNDYSGDELANILIPVFLSQPDSEVGKEALKLLGESKSLLAYHALSSSIDLMNDEIKPLIKKNISMLKLAGIREDNSLEYYKKLLSTSRPYRLNLTYPDGQGNQAMIFSRINENYKIQFVAIVLNEYCGIKDCFGFNELSKFECDTIIDRFYREEKSLEISPENFRTLLYNAELTAQKSKQSRLPYEYVCWKNLLADIEFDRRPIKTILDNMLDKHELTMDEFNSTLNADFMVHWFMDAHYSDEFEEFIKDLNTQLKSGAEVDFDQIVDLNVDRIFYKEEKEVWSRKILNCSYLKLITGAPKEAEILYNIYNSNTFKQMFFKFILRKSIYEYYFTIQYNNDTENFSIDEITQIVAKIESLWVK